MNYSIDDILKLAEDISTFNEINLTDIPCIDLYMDQVTTLFEDKLSHLKRNNEEAILTKTMINNYAKARILTPIKNKKYNKQQIIILILIYNLKQILSLEDIKLLLTPLIDALSSTDMDEASLDSLYKCFLSMKNVQAENFSTTVSEYVNTIGLNFTDIKETKSRTELIILILTLINSSNLQKRLAENLIDNFFKNEPK
jgi:Domain of unknown function (DUF1836).